MLEINDDFLIENIKMIKELYEGEIFLDKKILKTNITKNDNFVLFDKEWLEKWKIIVCYEKLKDKCKNCVINRKISKELIDESRSLFIENDTKEKLNDLGEMDCTKLQKKIRNKVLINVESNFVPILSHQCAYFSKYIIKQITVNAQISNGVIYIHDPFPAKNEEQKLILLYKDPEDNKEFMKNIITFKPKVKLQDVVKVLKKKKIDEIFNLTEYINEIVELNSQIKNYIQQIKNFEDQLNCEKEKNKNLLNENSILKEKIQKIENEINKIQEFQKPIKIGKDKMKKFKKKEDEKHKIFNNYNPLNKDNIQDKYYDSSKQKKELNNEILFIRNDKIKEDEIFNLNQKIKDLNRNIERYPYILNENENLLSIIFRTKNEKILFSMVCKSTDNIKILESKIYKKYPEISCFENYFTFKGIIIDKNESLEKNNINDGDLIIINH